MDKFWTSLPLTQGEQFFSKGSLPLKFLTLLRHILSMSTRVPKLLIMGLPLKTLADSNRYFLYTLPAV